MSSFGSGSISSFESSMQAQPKSNTRSPVKAFVRSVRHPKERKNYGMVAQTDTGSQEIYACNMDQQSLNRDANLEERLEKFFHANAPHYKSRIPVIMDAYREWPMLLFGDLDHNYGTDFSRPAEKDVWDKEDLERKRIRVQVAQDYIYCAMNEKDYMHPREVGKYTQAKLGTSKARVPKQMPSKRMSGSRKRRAARKVVQGVSKVAGSIGAGATTIRRSVGRVSGSRKQRNQRLSAPQVVKVQSRP